VIPNIAGELVGGRIFRFPVLLQTDKNRNIQPVKLRRFLGTENLTDQLFHAGTVQWPTDGNKVFRGFHAIARARQVCLQHVIGSVLREQHQNQQDGRHSY
jgi:hypothetical protein